MDNIFLVTTSLKAKWITIQQCHQDIPGACYIQGSSKYSNREDPPNDDVNVYVVFEIIHLDEKDEIKQTITAHLKMKMFWSDPRIKTNFSHEEDDHTIYDEINLRISNVLLPGRDIRDRIRIWLPDYDFDCQSMVTPVSENWILTSLKLIRKPFGPESSMVEMALDMKMTVLCDFIFLDYPMDFQACNFTFRNKRFPNNRYRLNKEHQVF